MASIKEKLEWLGGAAIVMSLLLVAYEIRQNTNAIAAQAVFDLNEAANRQLLMLTTDAELSRLVRLGDTDPDALSAEEQDRYRYYVWFSLNLYESDWTYYQRGIVSPEELESWRIDYCQTISQSGFQRYLPEISAHASAFGKVSAEWCSSEEKSEN